MSSLKGKVALITGASSGIGEGTAIHFARLGCRLSLTGRNEENMGRVAALCQEAGLKADQICTIAGDINDESCRKSIIATTIKTFGELNVLINNAGMAHYVSISEVTPEQYDEMFATNSRSQLYLTQLALPYLIKSKGNIVTTSSICGQKAMPMIGVYCMSKASLDMFTQCLALEMAPHGVRVNAVKYPVPCSSELVMTEIWKKFWRGYLCPGTIVSNLARRSQAMYQDDELYKKFLEAQARIHPLGRVGIPEDCASAIAFLASDEASFITGQILFVDGGRNCVSTGVATNIKS